MQTPKTIAIANAKGGAGKTITAVTLAGYLHTLGSTVLFDGDESEGAIKWAKRGGEDFPFGVLPASRYHEWQRGSFTYTLFDTHPSVEDVETAASIADLVIIPAVPDGTDTDGLLLTIATLQRVQCKNFKVLLTRVPSYATKAAADLREGLQAMGVNVFTAQIPRLDVFGKAATQGLVVNQLHNKTASRAWEAYVALGKEILA